MCRLIAYCGPPIPLENIVIKPSHSLVVQSQVAEEAKLAVNGDGFGLAWYAGHDRAALSDVPNSMPALYKEIMPAWANPNLLHICRAVRSGLFLAHVRAATGTPIQQTNCHPFRYRNWLLVHNGPEQAVRHSKLPIRTTPQAVGNAHPHDGPAVMGYCV